MRLCNQLPLRRFGVSYQAVILWILSELMESLTLLKNKGGVCVCVCMTQDLCTVLCISVKVYAVFFPQLSQS